MAAASMLGMLLLAMLVLVPIVLGVAMLINSRRGGLGYPACGQCKYNLSASIGKTDRCPECGSAFATAGILPPRGPRRRLMAWTGAALIALPLMCGGFGSVLSMVSGYRAQSAVRQQQAAAAAQQAAIAAQSQPTASQPSGNSDSENESQ